MTTSAQKQTKVYEQLPVVFHFSTDEKTKQPVVKVQMDSEAATTELRSLVRSNRFGTISNRLHGAYRQTATALFEMYCEDSDRVKAGHDRYENFNKVLIERGLEPVDWTATGCEVWLIALYKRERVEGSNDPNQTEPKYKGLCVYAEKGEAGNALLEKLKLKPNNLGVNASPPNAEFRSEPIVTDRSVKKSRASKK